MQKRLHFLQHVPFEGLGSIEAWASEAGFSITSTRLFAGEMPPDPEALDWLVVMGGPMGIYDEDKHAWLAGEKRFIETTIKSGKTVLGVCLGAQLIAGVLGATVRRNPHKEIGWFPVERTEGAGGSRLSAAIPDSIEAFHWHGDTFDLPSGAVHLARSEACENQAFVYDERVVGLQYHLETTRRSAELLIENCSDELVEAPWIQTPQEMLADDSRFERINRAMANLLDIL